MGKDDDPFGSDQPSTDPFGRPISGGDDPFGSPAPAQSASRPPPGDAWQTAPSPPSAGDSPAQAAPGAKADGAIASLILGIVGLFFCQILSPFAWGLGSKAQRLVDASGGALLGRGEATAGKVLGIIGTVFLVIEIVALIALIVFGTSVETGTDTTRTIDF